MPEIKPGNIIKGYNWPEPVEVKLVEPAGNYVHIMGATTISRQHVDDLVPHDDFLRCEIQTTETQFSEEAWKVFLALEATRYRFASLYDPLLAMNTSKVDPLPHQIEAVYGYVLKIPRIRFLIADDPGAGKTIMAGLIIKELKMRNLARRVLIIAPGHIKDQWRRELADRFDEKFLVIDRGGLDSVYGENAWMRENHVITSIDFAKRDDILPSLSAAHFNLIVVDEAHKMSAYKYGDKIEKTSRYKLGEVLSRITDHLLFLTATPHKGDPENFRLFLDLLEPGFFATNEMVQESIKNKDNPLFIRRIKEDLKDFEGKPLFLPRYVKTVSLDLSVDSPIEKELYNSLSKYVVTQYNKALVKDKKRNVAFALVILQRRLASSTYALLKSLERRKKRLEDLLKGAQDKIGQNNDTINFEEVEDLSEEERWKLEEMWEVLSVSENREELREEIATIDQLINQSRHIIENEDEIKLRDLKSSLFMLFNRKNEDVPTLEIRQTVDDAIEKYPDDRNRKILIFTESRDTLEYLENKIKRWGFSTITIHGGMKLEDRVKAESTFKNEASVLIATEAAGEGINLQFCNLMINYDIPWNPNRLEQRMGRIHRYGQNKEVFVFNMVAIDTREGKVLKRLFDKLEEIKAAMGSDKVFDVLSEIMDSKSLSQLLIDAASNARNLEEILKDLEFDVDEEYISQVKENLGESLATRYIDYTRIKEMAQKAREYKLIPEYTQNWFEQALVKSGGRYAVRKDNLISIDSIPFDVRKIADDDIFKKSYGVIGRRYPKVTFDKDIAFRNPDAEFVCFGHSLFEAMMNWVEHNFSGSLLSGAVFTDPDGKLDGYILFYEGEVKDGTGSVAGKRLFSFYADENEVRPFPPSLIWNLQQAGSAKDTAVNIEEMKSMVSGAAIGRLEEYKQQLLEERNRQAEIKQKYGVQSLQFLICRLDDELITLLGRKDVGENVDLVIRNKEERKFEYERALKDLSEQVQKEKSLTMGMPRFKGIIRVIPSTEIPSTEAAMQRDDEVEVVGMKVAMEYEVSQGRFPEDISAENLGFDVRSKDKDGNFRYIEVKARAKTGAVELTRTEWFTAQRFKDDYYLYAVMNAASSPELIIIQNPAENTNPLEKVDVRYLISFKEIQSKKEGS